jgi:hypothetical protein
VYYAPLNSNGSVGSWSTNVNALPAALDGAKATSANGYIYFLGGSDGSSSVGSTKTTSYYTSTSRVNLFGALDLVGISGENLADGGSGGQLTAGNTKIIGSLDVQGQASFGQNVAVNGDLNLSGLLSLANKSSAPSGIAGAMYYDSTNNKFKCYTTTWVDCDTTGGGGGTGKVVLAPEYTGAVLNADGSNNTGALTSGFTGGLSGQGFKHNWYQWTTATATPLQDYDIIVNLQVPSDYSSGFGTFKIWAYGNSTSTSNNNIEVTVKDQDETVCASSTSVLPGSANTWTEQSVSLSTCTYAANDILTVTIKMSSLNNNAVRIGEMSYQYTK